MKIKVQNYSDYWECADKCCTHYDEVSIFTHNGKEYEYRSYDRDYNKLCFIADALDIEFEEEEIDAPGVTV